MLILGIDTGGTYTDGVVIERETKKIYCETKALTTPQDLAGCITKCMQQLKFSDWDKIGMVCLSTTLATNAVVEGKGCPTGLVLLGRVPKGEIPAEQQVVLDSSVNIRGNIQERIHRDEVVRALEQFRGKCDAIAVSGYASVRNPIQEQQVKQIAEDLLGIPVVCGHELTGTLGFYERTVTAVLNARLIPIIKMLIASVTAVMNKMGINAPIMVMRGEGSLMRASYSMQRPIETILSGPAASVVGGVFLSGKKNCQVIDIGGTTMDIAYVQEERCKVSREGAVVAGWHTRVRAMEVCTYGLGGDSEIHVTGANEISIGPKKANPLCREAMEGMESCLTPTDILHASGEFVQWNAGKSKDEIKKEAARYGRSYSGQIEWLQDSVADKINMYCLKSNDILHTDLAVPIVGVGAPAETWLTMSKKKLQRDIIIPEHAPIANAIGAAVGQIFESTEILIRKDRVRKQYIVFTEVERMEAKTLQESRMQAQEKAREIVEKKARDAGANRFEYKEQHCVMTDKQQNWIEEHIVATAVGYPKQEEKHDAEKN